MSSETTATDEPICKVSAPRDIFIQKLLKQTPQHFHDSVIRPLYQEILKRVKPYLWFLAGVYLSLILPILVLVGLLVHAHGYIMHLATKLSA